MMSLRLQQINEPLLHYVKVNHTGNAKALSLTIFFTWHASFSLSSMKFGRVNERMARNNEINLQSTVC